MHILIKHHENLDPEFERELAGRDSLNIDQRRLGSPAAAEKLGSGLSWQSSSLGLKKPRVCSSFS